MSSFAYPYPHDDPEHGTLNAVLPSDLPPRRITFTTLPPVERKPPRTESESSSPTSSASQAASDARLRASASVSPVLPVLLNRQCAPTPFTPVDMEGVPVPTLYTPIALLSAGSLRPKAHTPSTDQVTLISEKAAAVSPSEKPNPNPNPAPGKPKFTFKRASRWVRFQLWFNTYRLVFLFAMWKQASDVALSGNFSLSS
jgi:hypothetical protein